MTRAEKLADEWIYNNKDAKEWGDLSGAFLAGWKKRGELDAEIATQHGMCWDDSYGNACRAIERAIRQLDEEEA